MVDIWGYRLVSLASFLFLCLCPTLLVIGNLASDSKEITFTGTHPDRKVLQTFVPSFDAWLASP